VATAVCVPLLALDVLSGAGGQVDPTSLSTDAAPSSLVVAAVPSTDSAVPATTEAPVTTEAPATTVAAGRPTTSTTATPRPSTTTTTRAPTTTTTRAPAPAPVPAVSNGAVWDALALCETGGNWAMNSGNGYSGGLQFHSSTWAAVGGTQYAPEAWMATREQQIAAGERVLAASGWSAWPGCARKLGLR
jgi:hypothetical protein